MAQAGRDEPLFADDAIAYLHRVANGLPRALNTATTVAIIAAAATGKDLVRRRLRQESRRRRRVDPGLTRPCRTARRCPAAPGPAASGRRP